MVFLRRKNRDSSGWKLLLPIVERRLPYEYVAMLLKSYIQVSGDDLLWDQASWIENLWLTL